MIMYISMYMNITVHVYACICHAHAHVRVRVHVYVHVRAGRVLLISVHAFGRNCFAHFFGPKI
jgi:hypothetical protein